MRLQPDAQSSTRKPLAFTIVQRSAGILRSWALTSRLAHLPPPADAIWRCPQHGRAGGTQSCARKGLRYGHRGYILVRIEFYAQSYASRGRRLTPPKGVISMPDTIIAAGMDA